MRKLNHISVFWLRESDENRDLYDPPTEADIEALAESIRKRGLLHELIITKDNYIISGHRRRLACMRLGKRTVPCKVMNISYERNTEKFLRLLVEANRQRVKKTSEVIHEEVVNAASNNKGCDDLIDNRIESSDIDLEEMEIIGKKRRFGIKGNKPLLDAAVKIIYELVDYWPLSDRAIHYKLLNDPPLKHRGKPDSRYRNDDKGKSYHLLTNILTRGRLSGDIPWEAIGDDSRPFVSWNVHNNTASFIKEQFDNFLSGYHRNFLQSQSNWIEIMGEKLTLGSIIRPVAMKYHIPYTLGHGYSSINPRHDVAERFKKSGKEKLIILLITDLDPDGDEIAQSFARSMRDDFGVDVYPIEVALNWDQIRRFRLPSSPDKKAKTGSRNYAKYMEKYHSDDVWELEALTPQQLQELLDEAIRGVINIDLFNQEMLIEKREQIELEKYRKQILKKIGKVVRE